VPALVEIKTAGQSFAGSALLDKLSAFEAARISQSAQWKTLQPASQAGVAEARFVQALREWAASDESTANARKSRLEATTPDLAEARSYWQSQASSATSPLADKASSLVAHYQALDTATLGAFNNANAQALEALRVIGSASSSPGRKLAALSSLDKAVDALHRLAQTVSDRAEVMAADVEHLQTLQGQQALAWTERLLAQAQFDRLFGDALTGQLAQASQAQKLPDPQAAQAQLALARQDIEQVLETQADTAVQRLADARLLAELAKAPANDTQAQTQRTQWEHIDADRQYAQKVLTQNLQALQEQRTAAQTLLQQPETSEADKAAAQAQLQQLQSRIQAQQQAYGNKVAAQAQEHQQVLQALEDQAVLKQQIEAAPQAQKAALQAQLEAARITLEAARAQLEDQAALERTRAQLLQDQLQQQAQAEAGPCGSRSCTRAGAGRSPASRAGPPAGQRRAGGGTERKGHCPGRAGRSRENLGGRPGGPNRGRSGP
jgi:hypothetical protein